MSKGLTKKQLFKKIMESENSTNTHYKNRPLSNHQCSSNTMGHNILSNFEDNGSSTFIVQSEHGLGEPIKSSHRSSIPFSNGQNRSFINQYRDTDNQHSRPSGSQDKNVHSVNSQSSRTSSDNREDKRFVQTMSMPFLGINRPIQPMTNISNNQSTTKKRPLSPMPPADPVSKNRQRASNQMLQKSLNGENVIYSQSAYTPSLMSDQFSKNRQRASSNSNIPVNSTNKMLQKSQNGENINVIYAQSAYASSPLSDQFSKNKNRKPVPNQQNTPLIRGSKQNLNAKIEKSTRPLPKVFYNMDYINSRYNTVDVNSKKENETWLKYPKNFLCGIIQNPIVWESFGPDDNKLHRATITLEIAGTKITGRGDAKTKKDAEKIAFLDSCYLIEAQGLMIHLTSPSGQRQNLIRQSTQQGSEIDYRKHVIEYCAAFDHVPQFEVFGVGPDHEKQWEAVVEFSSQGLIGRGRGRTKKEAEIKAAEAFKKHAEEYKELHGDELLTKTESNTMSEDVARHFIRFYCRFFKFKNPEFVYDGIGPSHRTLWKTSLIVQDSIIGSGKGSSKREAQAAAYLDAAIALRKDSPHLWERFETDKTTKGKNLNKPPPLINVSISESVSRTLNRLVNDLCDADIFRFDDNKSVDSEDKKSKSDQTFEDQINQRENKNGDQFTARNLNIRSKELYRDHQHYLCSKQTEKIRFSRNQLPITHYSNIILEAIKNNPVIVIVGSTGCGKTTQLPQMIFEDAIMQQRGSRCNVIVTQPRRIAAISVAQRVAYERSEKLGQTVGYRVRFDAKEPAPTGSILYCTTGVLLRRMHDEKNGIDALESITHIVVDEVHERDMNADFLLVILKQILRERRLNNRPPIKLILMSATIDTGIFSEYFGEFFSTGRCPVVEVPGKIFPVQQFFLEDLISKLRTHYGPSEAPQLDYSDSLKYVDREMQFAQMRKYSELLPQKMNSQTKYTMDIDNEIDTICSEIDDDNVSVGSSNGIIDWVGSKHNDVEKANAEIPYNLMALTIAHIVNTSKEGAILVFLPGLEEIMALNRLLTSPPYPLGINFSNHSRFRIHFLHSSLPSLSQQGVFESLPNSNMRKIILATNIAETSITIQDIIYVVDSGKVKEKRYDQSKRMTNLITTWISQSNSRQRSGRAGRVREGEYYMMMTRARYQSLEGYSTPEMLRSDLQEICLHIKALGLPATISNVLSQAIQPPDQARVFAALNNLKSLQALDHNEELTSLGKVLASLPLEPGLGKMVLLGAIFQCLDPILTIGASMASKNPFLSPPYAKDRADEIRFYWSKGLACDHFAVLNVYNAWYEFQSSGALHAANKFCAENLLSKPCLQTIEQIKIQLLSLLERAGVVPKRDHNHRDLALGTPEYNLNSNCIPLLRALICAGVYPNIALKTSKKTFRTRHENATFIHPASVNYKERAAKLAVTIKNSHILKQNSEFDENLIAPIGTLYAYSSKVKASGHQVFLRSTTRIDPLSTILFGGEIRTSNQLNNFNLIVDDWLQFNGENSSFAFVNKLKILLDRCLTRIYEKLEVTQMSANNISQHKHIMAGKPDDTDEQVKIMLVRGIVEVLENADRDLIKKQQNGNFNRSRLINY
ncbi:P-loop containing nucleoside triphosphate hydrolase protein [Gigaspora margarita]|uniref:P-loop containing nucleoside triphosphate hydrolase protein n=2 Tax=Gigaspora margarita TaxID=4874 RepID=A0A8H3XEN3_GIGMA|nr:P-loop containing nucleoside triphosphate hydrolase protein [Gigaspora margarita]